MHPINKKYFGNRNIGVVSNTTDNKIGGEGIDAIIINGVGNIEVDSNSGQPTLTIPAPAIPGGVQATATVTWEVSSITITSGNDYGTSYVNGETVTFTGASGVTATVTVAADDITGFTIVNRGSFTTIPTSETYQVVGAVGNDAQAEITWRIKSIVVGQKGSGYTPDQVLSWTDGIAGPVSGSAPGVPAITFTTDSGPAGSATNQENAIIIHANTDDNGTKVGDIIKQVNGFAYKVKTADGTRQKCLLVADSTPGDGEAYIKATDNNGNTYYVTKLTSRVATVRQWTNNEADWLFADGARAKWTLSSDINNDQVTIENA